MENMYTIEKIRKTVKMEQAQFATLVGIPDERVRNLEINGEPPSAEEWKKILNALSAHYRTPARLPTMEAVYANLLQQIAETLWGNLEKLSHPFLPQFDTYIETLYREARNAIFLGLHTAALATLCVLLEYVIKDLIQDSREKSKGMALSTQEEKEIERLMFGKAVAIAAEEKIIDDEEREKLQRIGEWMRNPLMHSKLLKITENDRWTNVRSVSMSTGETKTMELNGKEHRFIRKASKLERDKREAWPFFLWVESFIAKKYAETIEKAQSGQLGAMFRMEDELR